MFRKISTIIHLATLMMVALIVTESKTEKVFDNDTIGLTAIPNSFSLNTSESNTSYDEEFKVFEKDYPKRRKKRFLYYNVDTNLDVGFLIVIPITVALPQMSNLFNKWRKRRSIRSMEEVEESFEDHHAVQPSLDRISLYFEMIDIPEHHCQLRAICEFSAEPYKYFPLSDLILSRLRDPSVPSVAYEYNEHPMDSTASNNSTILRPKSLFKSYNTAADDGLAYGSESCEKNYGGQCKYSMDQILSMTALRIWSAMRTQIGFTVKDDFNF